MPRAVSKTTTNPNPASPLVFISYSHRDEAFRERLMVHLAPLTRDGVRTWVDSDMIAGDEIDPTIMKALKKADLFVALASPDYLHSSYCFDKEYQFALRKAKRKTLHVIVAIARHCQWKHTRIGRYLVLPKDGKAIEDFGRRSQAFEQIVEGIRAALKRIRSEAVEAVPPKPAKPRTPVTRAGAPRAGARQPVRPKKLTTADTKPARKPVAKKSAAPSEPKPKSRSKRKPASAPRRSRSRTTPNPSS